MLLYLVPPCCGPSTSTQNASPQQQNLKKKKEKNPSLWEYPVRESDRSTWFKLHHVCATFLSLLLLQVSNIDLIIRKFNKEFLKWADCTDCFCQGCHFLPCMKKVFHVTGQNIVRINIDGVCNSFSCHLCTTVLVQNSVFTDIDTFGVGR